jgi:hypothetical protein
METVNVSGLKNNPSEALRKSHQGVAVLHRDKPDALMAEMSLGDFVAHVSRLGITVVSLDAHEVARDMDTLESWLASS